MVINWTQSTLKVVDHEKLMELTKGPMTTISLADNEGTWNSKNRVKSVISPYMNGERLKKSLEKNMIKYQLRTARFYRQLEKTGWSSMVGTETTAKSSREWWPSSRARERDAVDERSSQNIESSWRQATHIQCILCLRELYPSKAIKKRKYLQNA